MAQFGYQARTVRGERITGTLDAPTEAAVEEALRERGLFVTFIRAGAEAAPAAAPQPRSASVKLNRRELALFTMHLATVMRSGLPLSLGLRNSIEEGAHRKIQTVAHT